MALTELRNDIQALIANADYQPVIERLKDAISEKSMYNRFIIIQSSIYENLKNSKLSGQVSESDFQIGLNRLCNDILQIMDALTEEDLSAVANDVFEQSILELGYEPRGTISLVNCNRSTAFDNFSDHFTDWENQPFQFYFILGCPTQQPNSFAERLVYEIIEKVLFEEDTAINYERYAQNIENTDIERVKIPNLPLGLNAEGHIRAFRKYFADRLQKFNQEHLELEQFIANKAQQLPYQFIAFTFKIESANWKPHWTSYFEWLIEVFKTNQKTKPTFLFFFVINMKDAHIQVNATIQQELDKILRGYDDASALITNLVPVGDEELRTWFSEGNVQSERKIREVIDQFKERLLAKGDWQNGNAFNMMDVEAELQSKVYVLSLKK